MRIKTIEVVLVCVTAVAMLFLVTRCQIHQDRELSKMRARP